MKLIFRTLIVLLLPFLTTSTADISNTKGLGLDFQDFVDIKDETTTLQFDFDREFYFPVFTTQLQLLIESSYLITYSPSQSAPTVLKCQVDL